MARYAEFEAAHIAARDIQPGDYLDPGVKVRVHAARMIGNNFVVAHRLRGSKAPGVKEYKPDESVRVWRKKK
ncbi:MAG: hypothetical protein EBT07_02255 [Actinobacteria bacterium]|nr:hypothetical protein [Actinomycetota bacterium]